MDIEHCLDIFYGEYLNRHAESDLPQEEALALLERRYPQGEVLAGKMPTLNDRIKDRLASLAAPESADGDLLDAGGVIKLFRQAYFEYRLSGLRDRRFTSLFSVLNTYVGVKYRFQTDDETLRALAGCAVDLWLVGEDSRDVALGNRTKQIALAARRLGRLCGLPVTAKDGEIDPDGELLLRAQRRLEEAAADSGGLPILERLFKEALLPRFSPKMDRYMIHRLSRNYYSTSDLPQPEIPFGYLFRIALKHLFQPVVDVRRRDGRRYGELLDLARDILLILNVSNAYSLLYFNISVRDLPEYVVKNSILDNLCLPPQYAPEFCAMVLGIYEEKRKALLPETSGLDKVHRWCMDLAPCAVFSPQDVSRDTGLSLKKVRYLLDLFSLNWDQVNVDYHLPRDPVNQWKCPLIKAPGGGRYFMLSPQFSGYAFCERLYALLQEKEPGIGRHLGLKVEALARTFFEQRGIVYHTGYYIGEDGKTEECDMILEDEKNILFIEIKKRPLREGFLQANDVEIFRDLAYGMLSAQVQAKKHLKTLIQNGSIPLYRDVKDPAPCYTLRLDGRKVKTMSVCLPEYAFLTQAFLAKLFMDALLRGSFHSLDPAQEVKLNKLNQLAGEYRDLIEELKKISPTDPREYNHFSHFRSLQQVWLVLQSCGTAGEAIKKLTWDDHLIFESVDFYSGLQAQDRWR